MQKTKRNERVAKLALMALPNIEVVTLLCALYGYVFGKRGILAAVVFVCIEPLIYGFNTWIISYFLYWPLVAFVFMMLGRAGVKNRFIIVGIAVGLTVWFGVLTSLVDIGLFTGQYDRFFYRFGVYYVRGAVFYALQIACNAVVFFGFGFLSRLLQKRAKSFL